MISNILTKNNIARFIVVIATLVFIYFGYQTSGYEPTQEQQDLSYGIVVAVEEEIVDQVEMSTSHGGVENVVVLRTIPFTVSLESGWKAGQSVSGYQYIDALFAMEPKTVELGDKVVLKYEIDSFTNTGSWTFVDYNRTSVQLFLVGTFFVIILIIGQWKGVQTVLSLILTTGVLFLVYIPSILAGKNIYSLTIVVAGVLIFASLILINGINTKTYAAICGNLGGLVVTGILTAVISKIMFLTGMLDSDYVMLTYLETEQPIDLVAIVWGGVIIGSLGAIMDVAMSIASAMNEVHQSMEDPDYRSLIKSGMSVGVDIIGTMTNTLILAYIGSSLAIVLLFTSYSSSVLSLFNSELIATEIMQAIVGSIGILFAVPLTVLSAAYIFTKNGNGKNYISNGYEIESEDNMHSGDAM